MNTKRFLFEISTAWLIGLLFGLCWLGEQLDFHEQSRERSDK